MHGDAKRVKDLLDRGSDIHARGVRALRLAAGGGRVEVIRLLLDRGADTLAGGNWVLRNSVDNGHADAAMLLIAHGADLEAGIEAAKNLEDHKMLDMLNRVKRSREEKAILLTEVPKPHRAHQARMIRMQRVTPARLLQSRELAGR